MRQVRVRRGFRGFTLVELLVVILIIAVVVAIVLPALGGVRRTARLTSTRSLLTELDKAINTFQVDQRRLPGRFDQRAMGSTENATRGLTNMESVLLDLAGGETTASTSTVKVGPQAANVVDVDFELIGVPGANNGRAYFVPQGKSFVAQNGTDGGGVQAGVVEHQNFPDIIDAFGQPILVWIEDETVAGPIGSPDDFARKDSGSTGQSASRFYWNSNAGFLNSDALGRIGRNQRVSSGGAYSLLGGGVADVSLRGSMIGVLGSPSYPQARAGGPVITVGDLLPDAPRGRFVVHSAGPDGFFFGSDDRGAKLFDGEIVYERNFYAASPGSDQNRHTDRNGNPTNIDLVSEFDDLVLSGGN